VEHDKRLRRDDTYTRNLHPNAVKDGIRWQSEDDGTGLNTAEMHCARCGKLCATDAAYLVGADYGRAYMYGSDEPWVAVCSDVCFKGQTGNWPPDLSQPPRAPRRS